MPFNIPKIGYISHYTEEEVPLFATAKLTCPSYPNGITLDVPFSLLGVNEIDLAKNNIDLYLNEKFTLEFYL